MSNKLTKTEPITQQVLQRIADGIAPTNAELQIVNRERFLAFKNIDVTIFDIVKSNGFSSIKQWQKVWGSQNIEDFIYVIIGDVVNFLSVGKTMDENQQTQTAKLIMQNHIDLSMEDLRVWSDRFKCGGYGKLYDCIDGKILLESLDAYRAERLEAIDNEHINSKSATPVIENFSPELIKILSNGSAIQEAKKSAQRERAIKNIEPTELDLQIQYYYKVFDRLHQRKGNKVTIGGQETSIKMIELKLKGVKRKRYDRADFIHMMLARKARLDKQPT